MPNPTALSHYVAKRLAIEAKLAALTEYCEDHFGETPDAINWSHVGTLSNVDNMLHHVFEFLGLETEKNA